MVQNSDREPVSRPAVKHSDRRDCFPTGCKALRPAGKHSKGESVSPNRPLNPSKRTSWCLHRGNRMHFVNCFEDQIHQQLRSYCQNYFKNTNPSCAVTSKPMDLRRGQTVVNCILCTTCSHSVSLLGSPTICRRVCNRLSGRLAVQITKLYTRRMCGVPIVLIVK